MSGWWGLQGLALQVIYKYKVSKREKIRAPLIIGDLAGIFATDAKKITKGMTRKEIELAERKASEEGWINRFKK